MGTFADMEKKIAAASADLPPKRSFEDLSRAEQSQVAKLTGYSVAEIRKQLAEAQAD
jgi:hypothetical protein